MPEKLMSDDDLKHIADLLMGAAHADGRLVTNEADAIREVLRDLVQDEVLPHELYSRMGDFDAEAFDLQECCAALKLDSAPKRRFILKLVARVTEGDDIHDLDETAYIKRVARCIGARPEEYADLTVEFSTGNNEGSTPPPVPED